MDCRGCGTQLNDPDIQAVNQAVDEVLQASIDDSRRSGGVCPLCGHSQFVPLWQRRWFQSSLLFGCWVVLGAIFFYRSPLKTSIAQESVRRATQNPRVKRALGEPIKVGFMSSGGVHRDETGWSEAKLEIPLRGPKGSATLRVAAGQGNGPWVFSTLQVIFGEKTEPIDLLLGKAEFFSDKAYLAVHTEPAMAPEFTNQVFPVPVWDGTFPVVQMNATLERGNWNFVHRLARDTARLQYDSPISSFEVSLDDGAFILQQTDLFVPDSMPLSLTRGYRVWDHRVSAFGVGATHSFDNFPFGTRNPYTEMNIGTANDRRIFLNRISKGTGYSDAWYEQVETASPYYKARFWWNGNGWTFKLPDGSMWLFPESYNAKNSAQGAAFEVRNPAGQRIILERDAERNLRRAISPNGRVITFQYEAGGSRISEVADDQGHKVTYLYDLKQRLISVRGTDNRITRYRYDDEDLITSIENESGRILLRNFYYPDTRIASQILGDNTEYRYRWELGADGRVRNAFLQTPDGAIWVYPFDKGVPAGQPRRSNSWAP